MWVMAGPAVDADSCRLRRDRGANRVAHANRHRAHAPARITTTSSAPTARDCSPIATPASSASRSISAIRAARAVVHDLVRWADVVTESFSPKAMRAWGFDYESLRKVKPDLIMLSSCLMGQTGPLAKIAGFGNMAAAIAGFHNLTGWPDRAAVRALRRVHRLRRAAIYRDGDSRGARLSAPHRARASTSISRRRNARFTFSGPRFSTTRSMAASRNESEIPTPPSRRTAFIQRAGDDQWVAIVCRNDDDWRRLCAAMENDDLGARLALRVRRGTTRASRRDRFVDRGVEPRTRARARSNRCFSRTAFPLIRCRTAPTRIADPQFAHRGHFVALDHPSLGKFTVEGPRAKLSRTPADCPPRCPSLGQDNQHVLESILGYDEKRISELVASGALG